MEASKVLQNSSIRRHPFDCGIADSVCNRTAYEITALLVTIQNRWFQGQSKMERGELDRFRAYTNSLRLFQWWRFQIVLEVQKEVLELVMHEDF